MNNLPTEGISRFDSLIEKFAFIKEKYGDSYPIILYEPALRCEENEVLKFLIEQRNSIHFFDEFKQAFKFAQSLSIGFIFITSRDFDEGIVMKNFGSLKNTYGRGTFDFEEESLLRNIFEGISDDLIKSLYLKVYLFFTLLELETEVPPKEDEEEVMIMRDLKDMAKDFRQEFAIIWYDPQICFANKGVLKQKFDIEERNIYDNFEELWKRIHNAGDPPFHLILTGKVEAEKIANEMGQLKDSLLHLYIYCNDPSVTQIKNRKIFVEETIEKLVPKITEGIRTKSKLTNSLPAFATEFDALDKSHIYNLHYYLQGLVNFENRGQAKNDFIKLAKAIYQSQKIFDFDKEYSSFNQNKILEWYTKESPVYKLVNNCLRVATSDSILYCRYLLRDLEEAIREKYKEGSHQFNGLVYRGAYISQSEWEKLENNVGKEIEMYGFLSTSQSIETAKNFLFSDMKNKILITIIVPPIPIPELDEQGFANISPNSDYQEAEILFNVRSKFRILEAGTTKINNQGKECRHLVLMYGAQLLRKYMTKVKPVINLELKLPSEVKCSLCESAKRLFAFQQDITEVRCLECLQKISVPQDIPLLALDFENNFNEKKIVKNFKAEIFAFSQALNFPFYGYRCHSCQGIGKNKYYKWIDLKTEKQLEQCADCFENMTGESKILFAERQPFTLWQESQAEWEMVDSDHQVEVSETTKNKNPGDVYLTVQQLDSCIDYDKKVFGGSKMKRWREKKKLQSLIRMGVASNNHGEYTQALKWNQKALEIIKTCYGNNHPQTAVALNSLGSVYQNLGQYQEALESFMEALEINKNISGDKPADTIISYNNIGSVFEKLGLYQEALEFNEKALDLNKSIWGDKHPKTAISYNSLASTFQSFGQYQEALEHYKMALDINKAVYGERHPETVTLYANLAFLQKILGHHQKAIEYHKKAIDLKKEISGDKHPQIAPLYNNLALVYQTLGQHQEASEYFRKALEVMETIFGDKNPQTATSYNNLATAHQMLGRYQEALEFYERALNVTKISFGEKHSQTAISYSNLALAYQSLGQHQEALKYFTKALDIMESIFGDKHPQTALLYNNIGSLCQTLGQSQEALKYFTKALEVRKTVFGENHSETATSYGNIGLLYQSLGQNQKALEASKKALEIRESIFGNKHPQTAASYGSLGLVLQSLGQYQAALICFMKALDVMETIFGDNHPETAALYGSVGSVHQLLGHNKQAIEYHRKALDITETIFGEKHPQSAILYNNLGLDYQNLGQYQEALEYLKKALEVRKIVFGEKHRETAASYSNIALIYDSLEQYQEALEYSLRAVDIQKMLFGEKHPDIALSYNNIGAVLETLGRYLEALTYHGKALDLNKIIFGDKHPQTAISYNNLGFVYKSLEQHQKALECFAEAMSTMELFFGDKHPHTAKEYHNYATASQNLGDHQRALEYFTKALAIRKAMLGDNHPDTLKTFNSLESLQKSLNQNQEGC